MAITSSAKKALRASRRKRTFNMVRKNQVSKVVKQYKKMVGAGDIAGAAKLLPSVQKALDKAAKVNVLKRGNVARKKSRLMAMVKGK